MFRFKGVVLVEVIVAISIVLTGIVATYTLATRAIGLNRVVAERHIATYLAAEGIEMVKNFIDSNVLAGQPWNRGLSDGRYELDYSSANNMFSLVLTGAIVRPLNYDPATGHYLFSGSFPATRFRRLITLANLGGGNELRVESRVDWETRGGATFAVDLENHFFNWR